MDVEINEKDTNMTENNNNNEKEKKRNKEKKENNIEKNFEKYKDPYSDIYYYLLLISCFKKNNMEESSVGEKIKIACDLYQRKKTEEKLFFLKLIFNEMGLKTGF